MAGAAASGGAEEERPLHYVLALSVSLPLPVAVARMDAAVPRKARTGRQRPRPKPAGWWDFRLPVPLVKGANNSSPEKEGTRPPRLQRLAVCLGLEANNSSPADLEEERPAKKARRCVQCGSADTPQWRSGPMGRSTLCNACGVRLRAAGALRETAEHRPLPVTTPRKAAAPPRPLPGSPGSDSDSPICERRAPPGDVYLVRKQPKRERRTPRKQSPPSSPSPAIYLVKKKKPSKKPWRPRNTGQRCLHCGTTSTPQWREGPLGRHTLCNACGVRYRQGRLLPEYRPAASPTFVPSEHASRHREVLQLHRQSLGGNTQRRKQQPNKLSAVGDNNGLLPDPGSDEDDKNNVFLVRRERPEKEAYPPTPVHRPLPQPVDDDPRGCGGTNGSAMAGGVVNGGGTNGSATAGGGVVGGSTNGSATAGGAVDGGGTNGSATAGAVAGCSGGGDKTDALDSVLLEGPSAPLIVDGGNEFLVS